MAIAVLLSATATDLPEAEAAAAAFSRFGKDDGIRLNCLPEMRSMIAVDPSSNCTIRNMVITPRHNQRWEQICSFSCGSHSIVQNILDILEHSEYSECRDE